MPIYKKPVYKPGIVPSLPVVRATKTQTMKSLFTNNTNFYRPGSLASGGVGTVVNHRHKLYSV
jgi:hypothetical protein